MTRTRIGMHPLTKVEQQGYDPARLAAQIEGTIPVTRYCNITGKPYTTYKRDLTHPRWAKKEVKKRNPRQTKTHTLDIEELLDLEDAA